ncbi:MAG: hypothetical protein WCI62_01845 [Erysipelotrichaceae bacterium]
MIRLTHKDNQLNTYNVSEQMIEKHENGYNGDAISKLAKFEDFYDGLMHAQAKLTNELESLRAEGQNHSVRFRELFTQKMMINHILIQLKAYEIE